MKTKINFKQSSRRMVFGTLLLMGALVSCKKREITNDSITNNKFKGVSETVTLETKFAKILAKAVKNDHDLRTFIKSESLKQFDNDYDILYQLVKNSKITNNESLRDKILKFTTEKELNEIETKLPLLTIFVPTMPDFSPIKWNTNLEIPSVAINYMGRAINLYDEKGDSIIIKKNQIPGFPVLVVKQNERVVVNNNNKNNKLSVLKGAVSLSNKSSNDISFTFIDEVFNGNLSNNTQKTKLTTFKESKLASLGAIGRLAPSPNLSDQNAIDQINVDAYNSGSEWQRDFVYYGITPSNPNGSFRHNYSEFITSFKLLDNFSGLSEQSGDPNFTSSIVGKYGPPIWFEGNYEFRITVLVNSKNGLGNEITKIMNVNANDLYNVVSERMYGNFPPYWWKVISITSKEYYPNIELVPWDLENYGTAWKFIFYEMDPDQEIVNNYENTTTFATNFEINGGVKDKIGAKFGISTTSTEKRTYSVKTTLTSDFLGEATLTFDQPVIIGSSNGKYLTREITTGNNLTLSVEPRRVF